MPFPMRPSADGGGAVPPVPEPRRGRLRALAARLQPRLGGLRFSEALTIVRTSGSMVGTALLTSILGFAFWALAARQFDPRVVGLSSAVVAAMLLLARVSSYGMGVSLAGALATRIHRRWDLLVPGLATTAIASGIVGLTFALLAPLVSSPLAPLAAGGGPVLFALGVALSATGGVLDQALIGLLRGGTQLARNAVFAVGKLVLLAAGVSAAIEGDLVIVAVWIAGEALSLVAVALLRPADRVRPSSPDWRGLRQMASSVAAHHALNVARFAPSLAMPLIVTTMFSTEQNAVFYVAYLLAAATQLVGSSSTFTLYAVARRQPENLGRQIRFTVTLSVAAVIPGIAILLVIGEVVLGVIGSRYADEAGALLPLLALQALPLIVRDHWIALVRIRDHARRGAVLTTIGALFEVGCAVAGGVLAGLPGVVAGWLVGITLGSLLQAPAVWRASRPVRSGTGAGPNVLRTQD